MDRKSEKIFETHKDAIKQEASIRYGIKSSDLRRLGSFESIVYEYDKDGEGYILKITHSIHRTPQLVRGELDWTRYLSDHGVSVSRTVTSANGELLEVVDGNSIPALEDDYFLIYAVEKAPGKFTQPDDWSDNLIREWGRIVGKMHALAKGYEPMNPLWKRFEWYEDETLKVEDHIPPSQPIVIEKSRNLIERMKLWPVDKDSYGLIHSDLHHSNFVVNNDRITVFDFDDCLYCWLGYDITIPLFYALRDHRIDPDDVDFARHFLSNFLKGYRQENSIGQIWIRRIPDFLKLRELDLYSIIYAEDAADDNGWCRRFMENRRSRIENDIPVIEMDFSQLA